MSEIDFDPDPAELAQEETRIRHAMELDRKDFKDLKEALDRDYDYGGWKMKRTLFLWEQVRTILRWGFRLFLVLGLYWVIVRSLAAILRIAAMEP